MSDVKNAIREELKKNSGVLRFAPAWVGRTILKPGRRLKLDVRDIYARGAQWGGISERWMASTGMVDNGETTWENEGMSFVVIDTPAGPKQVLFKDAIDEVGELILGKQIMNKWGGLKSFAKFYDFQTPIPHHVHLREEHAKAVGDTPKPYSPIIYAQLPTDIFFIMIFSFIFNKNKESFFKTLSSVYLYSRLSNQYTWLKYDVLRFNLLVANCSAQHFHTELCHLLDWLNDTGKRRRNH